MFEQLAAWLERFSPATRILIVALVPAFLVFVFEELTRPAHRPQPPVVAEKPDEAPLKHTFVAADVAAITNLATQSRNLLQSLDQNMSQVRKDANEPVCLNGLRYYVYNNITNTLSRLQQDLALSVHMQKAEDEAFVNASAFDTIGHALPLLSEMDVTINTMSRSCQGNQSVSYWGNQIRPVLTQSVTALRALQARASLK